MGDRNRRLKVRKPVGWDKDGSIGKAEAVHTSKAKWGIRSLLPTSRQVFSHLQESRAPSWVNGDLGGQMPSLQTSPLPPSSPSFILLSIVLYGTEYPFGQLGSAVPAVPPPSSLSSPSLLTGGVGWEAEKALTLCKHGSAVTKTSPCYQYCSQHKSNAQLLWSYLLWRKLTPPQPKPAYLVEVKMTRIIMQDLFF